ncbi:uncharacterized protein PGTG_14880 [Puccinia graminis f. sp. tritici CRL 75-36-700-3]|uniref:Uncharacterized protein n=1 Tax=Puccinia graminis f. sp. tritici (strain CRL 75-36-700-3 / race SCCL) TaxID=418459 RepID=E3KXV3_PUCGT|nr:uncharacterized protein PGTG_14880 [Puccinia graminis f. sp. tritici CRL 75-36-700-3]EFP89039.1 hypothetical protein PGTG_14880 [Puccinia graminis f. sp. tritici CRL 75-36-700-3]
MALKCTKLQSDGAAGQRSEQFGRLLIQIVVRLGWAEPDDKQGPNHKQSATELSSDRVDLFLFWRVSLKELIAILNTRLPGDVMEAKESSKSGERKKVLSTRFGSFGEEEENGEMCSLR